MAPIADFEKKNRPATSNVWGAHTDSDNVAISEPVFFSRKGSVLMLTSEMTYMFTVKLALSVDGYLTSTWSMTSISQEKKNIL
jgi:hypothetical protein